MMTQPIRPMLAVPMSKANITDWRDWSIEVKYDGVRLIVDVGRSTVTAWTRPRGSSKEMAVRPLPAHLVKDLLCFPQGVYDGELIAGTTSTDVTRLDLEHERRFVMFDVLNLLGEERTRELPYCQRRARLMELFDGVTSLGHVDLAVSQQLTCKSDVTRFVKAVWDDDGEGAILKRNAARYQAGKRSPDYIKVKKESHVTMTIVGFQSTKGIVLDRGRFAIVVLEDTDGNRTTVKTKDDFELNKFEQQSVTVQDDPTQHPALGRKLVVEYQDRTRDGGYRHPRWDRWEDE